ncbi:hypothetical protein TURU_021670 [Turdus rufiventris]|nr:hypothetical protein TURU_021670 [Turdus rufiventris]
MRSALDEPPVVQLVQDVTHQMESILLLQEVMEKLQRVNQSLELTLMALEDVQSRLEKHLEHLKAIPDLDGQSQSATSSSIPHSSYFMLLILLLVPASFQAILLLLFLASSILGTSAISTLLVLAVAGHWLVASTCCGARRIRPVVPRKEPRYQLTSTPERESNMELLQEELDKMEMSCLQEPSYPEQPQEVARNIPGHVSPNPSGRKTTLSSCGVRSLCQSLTRAGQRCRKKAIPGQEFCHIHTTSSSLAMD